jgi:hypothetical protein
MKQTEETEKAVAALPLMPHHMFSMLEKHDHEDVHGKGWIGENPWLVTTAKGPLTITWQYITTCMTKRPAHAVHTADIITCCPP